MKECDQCEYRGYSRELCRAHSRKCAALQGKEPRPVPVPVKIGAKTLAGAGLGVATVFLGTTAVSLVGGAALIHAVLFKLGAGAGLAGGGVGFFKAVSHRDPVTDDGDITSRGER